MLHFKRTCIVVQSVFRVHATVKSVLQNFFLDLSQEPKGLILMNFVLIKGYLLSFETVLFFIFSYRVPSFL